MSSSEELGRVPAGVCPHGKPDACERCIALHRKHELNVDPAGERDAGHWGWGVAAAVAFILMLGAFCIWGVLVRVFS